jgi:hypothetical protein
MRNIVGGYAEVRAAIQKSNVDALIARTKHGVVAFGTDTADKRILFIGVKEFDIAQIESRVDQAVSFLLPHK